MYVALALLSMAVTTLVASDDLLAAFACGTAFAWDDWWVQSDSMSSLKCLAYIELDQSTGSLNRVSDFSSLYFGKIIINWSRNRLINSRRFQLLLNHRSSRQLYHLHLSRSYYTFRCLVRCDPHPHTMAIISFSHLDFIVEKNSGYASVA